MRERKRKGENREWNFIIQNLSYVYMIKLKNIECESKSVYKIRNEYL